MKEEGTGRHLPTTRSEMKDALVATMNDEGKPSLKNTCEVIMKKYTLPTHCTSSGALVILYQGSVVVQDQRSAHHRAIPPTTDRTTKENAKCQESRPEGSIYL